jgi:PBS lyase HEAT-like repeat
LPIAGVAVSLGMTGCAGTWDTLTSHRFREHPFETTKRMWSPEDPVAILRADPPRAGDERAAAMRRLQEPIRNKGTQEDQDVILAILEAAATNDTSPVMRLEAVGALGRFQDPRAAAILMTAYQNAHGRAPGEPTPAKPTAQEIVTAGLSAGRSPTRPSHDPFPTATGPSGFPPEWVTAIRCRSAESLGEINRPESTRFLAAIAGGAGPDIVVEGSDDREVRLAAIRGLGKCRQPESVIALAQVLNAEADKKDTALIGRTREELVQLTGKKLPADPQQWNAVVQAGVVIAPAPTWFDHAVENAVFWK